MSDSTSTILDVPGLLRPISPDAPAGPNLEYDKLFIHLESLVRGTPEQRIGDSVIDAVEPDWRRVKSTCLELLGRSKDLRVAMYLTLAALVVDGLPGLRDGLLLLHGLVDGMWDSVHPALDPEDDNDPLMRLNLLSALSPTGPSLDDPMRFRERACDAPICESPRLGRFSLKAWQIAHGERPAELEADVRSPTVGEIDAACDDTPVDRLDALHAAAVACVAITRQMETSLDDRIGADRVPDLAGFRATLSDIARAIEKRLVKRKPTLGTTEDTASEAVSAAGRPAGGASRVGEINSPEDVVQAIDRICEYYARQEPSSPLPLLLGRAKRLVGKSFLEIVQELAPGTASSVASLGGNAE